MAKVRVAAGILSKAVFMDRVRILDAVFDPINRCVVFEIEGQDVPKEAEYVDAVITERQREIEFKPIHPTLL